MMATLHLKLNGPCWALWGISVQRWNLNKHCIHALLGERWAGVSAKLPQGRWHQFELPEPQGMFCWYLCGVSVRSVLSKNAHLMTVPDGSEVACLDWGWGEAAIEGARAVPVVPDYIPPQDPLAHLERYTRCRNWQAAWMLEAGAVH